MKLLLEQILITSEGAQGHSTINGIEFSTLR